MGIALIPLRRREGLHPCRRHHGKAVQRSAECLSDALQPIEHANRGPHMRRVRAWEPTRFEQSWRPCERQEGIKEEVLRLPCDEPGAELTQDGMVEARIGEV